MKKRVIAFAAAAAAVILAAQTAFASQTMYVKGDKVNYRTKPSTDSEVAGQVYKGGVMASWSWRPLKGRTENG